MQNPKVKHVPEFDPSQLPDPPEGFTPDPLVDLSDSDDRPLYQRGHLVSLPEGPDKLESWVVVHRWWDPEKERVKYALVRNSLTEKKTTTSSWESVLMGIDALHTEYVRNLLQQKQAEDKLEWFKERNPEIGPWLK